VLDGNSVTTNRDTSFKRGSCSDLENGDRVKVKGRRQILGTVVAREVELRR
jgi:hypothetical protein